MVRSRVLGTAIVGLIGAIIGSFSMMLFASTHFAGVAGPGNTPPAVNAAPLEDNGSSDQARIVSAVKRVTPSVVALNVTVNGQQLVPADPFSQFFGGPSQGQMRPYHARASGSGFVYSKDGLIITNAHVVQFGRGSNVKIEAVFANGDKVPAKIYAANPAADLALVKVDNYAKLPPPVTLGDSNAVQAGQWAIAIGEPFELQQSVSVGVVSGFNRTETAAPEGGSAARTFKGLLQTSAPINPGNSGGPLIDYAGHVIGVNQLTANPQAGAQGIGFAIPVDTVKQQVAMLQQHPGQVNGPPTPYIGISMTTIDDNVRSQLNYHGTGVAVQGVYQGGPADQAGLQPGDVIQKIDGKDVTTTEQIQDAIRNAKPGQQIRLDVWSGGMKKYAMVKVGTAPSDFPVGQVPQQDENGGQ
jgi:serine protease Do